ncbi:C40 family peptidase [Streptomyces orinoci]|uniref:C40 family peptidase n=1 Tax=Streptomyces orinoci TaxID=67339 RepID=A0ABV3JTK7_STRON|nr:C40 family peptidase [Streptomyces orinoci]
MGRIEDAALGYGTDAAGGARRRAAALRRRRRLLTATALVCALTALAAPGTALADPTPPGQPAESAEQHRLEEVHSQVEALYRQAESATDAYNAADEQTRLQQKNVAELNKRVDAARQRVDTLQNRIGALARAQYRDGGGMPPQARLLLAGSPEAFLEGLVTTHKGQEATRLLLAEARSAKYELDGYAKAAGERWKLLDAEKKKKADAKKDIEAKLKAAQDLESRLAAQEKERLRKLEEDQARQAQRQWLASDPLKGLDLKGLDAASPAGRRAVQFATAQMGKDYVWGAVGPDTYDCSGLTSTAWAAAGRPIPRTSQEQWQQLPKVEIKDMRPGDLIIYFQDASHVAMYVGDGTIVHAPRPGRQVTLAGAGSMPILGVVRPG